MFALRHSEWERLRKRVEQLKRPLRWLTNAAWALVGVGVSSILAWVAWLPTELQLPFPGRTQFAFVSPLLFILGVACVLVGIVFMVVDKRSTDYMNATSNQVVGEMDEIYSLYAPEASSTPVPDRDTRADVPSTSAPADPALKNSSIGIADAGDSVKARLATWTYLRGGKIRDNGNLHEILRPGDRIRHIDFGDGTVRAVTDEGRESVAEVYFDTAGRKRLLVRIAPIKPLGSVGPIPA